MPAKPFMNISICGTIRQARIASWLIVTRDTVTHEVLKVELAADVAAGMASGRRAK
jgi:sarcosine oxidase delta subunit